MSAIPYVPSDLSEPAAIVDAIRARRGGGLLNLDRMLLHSPPLLAAGGSMAQLQALRGTGALRSDDAAGSADAAGGASALFDPLERAALQLCRVMSEEVAVPRALITQLRQLLGSDVLLVELE